MIEIKNLYKSFKDKPIIQGLNLKVEPGEKINIIGPSGCGKSTILRIMMGLQVPDSGEVLVNGENIYNVSLNSLKKLRSNIGMLFQSGALFDSMNVFDNVAFTLRENLKMPESKVNEVVHETLSLVELEGSENKMPSALSGGMRKRIGLARAIASRPDILLYDEPTTGLDPILSTSIEDLIVKLTNQLNTTSIVVTHQLSTILSTGDKIYLMHEGKLLPPETPSTIMNSENPIIRNFIHGGKK